MARSSHLKQYKLVELIGRGGMGEVWLARHEMLDREVAIKLIRPSAAGGASCAGEVEARRRNVSGRIMAALGNSGAAFEAEKVEITINNLLAVKNGQEVAKNHLRLKNAFKNKRLDISINLHNGRHTSEVFTCDLSYDYVKINAAYTT